MSDDGKAGRLRVPRIYLPPTGGPLRWQDDQTGLMPAAVKEFWRPDGAPTPQQIGLLRDYVVYYLSAPCWQGYFDEERGALIWRVQALADTDLDGLHAALNDALELGYDPF